MGLHCFFGGVLKLHPCNSTVGLQLKVRALEQDLKDKDVANDDKHEGVL